MTTELTLRIHQFFLWVNLSLWSKRKIVKIPIITMINVVSKSGNLSPYLKATSQVVASGLKPLAAGTTSHKETVVAHPGTAISSLSLGKVLPRGPISVVSGLAGIPSLWQCYIFSIRNFFYCYIIKFKVMLSSWNGNVVYFFIYCELCDSCLSLHSTLSYISLCSEHAGEICSHRPGGAGLFRVPSPLDQERK